MERFSIMRPMTLSFCPAKCVQALAVGVSYLFIQYIQRLVSLVVLRI